MGYIKTQNVTHILSFFSLISPAPEKQISQIDRRTGQLNCFINVNTIRSFIRVLCFIIGIEVSPLACAATWTFPSMQNDSIDEVLRLFDVDKFIESHKRKAEEKGEKEEVLPSSNASTRSSCDVVMMGN